MVIVPTGGKDILDFRSGEIIATENLEACVAVAGISSNLGALMHLTQVSPVREFFGWFNEVMPARKTTRIYLVGGMKGTGEEFVNRLRQELKRGGYVSPREEVFTDYIIDLCLKREGAELMYKKQWMAPWGELQYQPLFPGML